MPTFASREDFSVVAGIAVQQQQLARWAVVLKPEILAQVRALAESTNDQATSGYDICRGGTIDQMISNLAHGHPIDTALP